MTRFDAIVVGAGPNGLTAATVLAKKGRKVLVLERASEIGGHTRAIEFAPGFRSPLDGDPGWVPPSVERATGVRGREPLTNDGPAASPADRLIARLNRFADVLGALYQLTPPDIDTTSLGEVLPLLRVGLKTRALGRADMIEFLRVMPMSVQDLVDDAGLGEREKAAIASAAVRDLRQGPRSAGTTFNLLHYMVGATRGSYRRDRWQTSRPDAFARAMADAARAAGVEIRTGAHVEQITVKDGAVSGVILGGADQATSLEIVAPIVVSTADPKRTLLGMVDPVWLDPEFMLAVKNIRIRGCAAFVLYGLRDKVDQYDSDVHLLQTTSLTTSTVDLERAADAAKYGEISEQPHVELFSPSLRWEGMAPAGKGVIAARVQYAPYALKKGSWDRAATDALEKKVTTAIGALVPDFASRIEHRVVLTPRDVEERFGVTEGALTQGELGLDQILFMRPVPGWGHYEMPVRGLFLGGAGAHPGPGVLGGAGLLAAKAALARR